MRGRAARDRQVDVATQVSRVACEDDRLAARKRDRKRHVSGGVPKRRQSDKPRGKFLLSVDKAPCQPLDLVVGSKVRVLETRIAESELVLSLLHNNRRSTDKVVQTA